MGAKRPAILYLILAGAMILLAIPSPGWLAVVLAWGALGCLWFSAGYFSSRGEWLFKSAYGRIPRVVRVILLPVLLGVAVYNVLARRADPSPPLQEIREGIWLGRRLLPTDRKLLQESGIRAILDTTAEFDALPPGLWPEDTRYMNIPVFDHDTPRASQMNRAIAWLRGQHGAGRPVLVHCALGQGRSVTVLLAFLKSLSPGKSYADLLSEVQGIRTSAKPNSHQMRMLERFDQTASGSERRRAAVVHNPVSGSGDGGADLERIKRELGERYHLEILETTPERGAGELAAAALDKGADVVIASGGDGTVASVAERLVGGTTPIGIVPRGTANALAVCLYGEATRLDPVGTAIDHLLAGREQKIDVGYCGDKPFFQMIGIGIEAGMVAGAERETKSRWGALAYLQSGWREMKDMEPFDANIVIDGRGYSFRAGNVVIANAAPFSSIFAQGGGQPDMTDGMLDVTVVHNVDSRRAALEALAELATGGIPEGGDHRLFHAKGRRIRIETTPPQECVVDGETGFHTPLDCKVQEGALCVLREKTQERDDGQCHSNDAPPLT